MPKDAAYYKAYREKKKQIAESLVENQEEEQALAKEGAAISVDPAIEEAEQEFIKSIKPADLTRQRMQEMEDEIRFLKKELAKRPAVVTPEEHRTIPEPADLPRRPGVWVEEPKDMEFRPTSTTIPLDKIWNPVRPVPKPGKKK